MVDVRKRELPESVRRLYEYGPDGLGVRATARILAALAAITHTEPQTEPETTVRGDGRPDLYGVEYDAPCLGCGRIAYLQQWRCQDCHAVAR